MLGCKYGCRKTGKMPLHVLSWVEVFISNALQKHYWNTSLLTFEIQSVLSLLSKLSTGDGSKIMNQRSHAHGKCGDMLITITQTNHGAKSTQRCCLGSPNLSAKGSTDLEATFTGYCVEPINIEILADPAILFMDMAYCVCLVLLHINFPPQFSSY